MPRPRSAARIIDRGVVFSANPPSKHQSCQYGSVAVLPGSGRWLCLFRAAETKNGLPKSALLTWSDDQGKTWTEHGNIRLTTDDRYFGWA